MSREEKMELEDSVSSNELVTKPYHPEKVTIVLDGVEKVLRAEKAQCVKCSCTFKPKVCLKSTFWPLSLLSAHDELNRTVHLCLVCLTAVHTNSNRCFKLACFEQLSVFWTGTGQPFNEAPQSMIT
jgi:hypothetical protein